MPSDEPAEGACPRRLLASLLLLPLLRHRGLTLHVKQGYFCLLAILSTHFQALLRYAKKSPISPIEEPYLTPKRNLLTHVLLSLDRLALASHRAEAQHARILTICLFVPLIAAALLGLASSYAAVRWVGDRRQRYEWLAPPHEAGRQRAATDAAPGSSAGGVREGGLGMVSVDGRRATQCGVLLQEGFTGILVALKACYVGVSVALYFVTNADGWCLNFVLYASAIHAFGNGISAKHNNLFDLTAFTLVSGMQLATTTSPLQSVLMRLLVHVVLSLLCAASARIEQRLSLSRYLSERLVAHEYDRMWEALLDLVPASMVSTVLSADQLPVTTSVRRRAVLLQMDLCNYTALASSIPSDQLARHVHSIFSKIDEILLEPRAQAKGLFKMDTIGDAYVAAAWLEESSRLGAAANNSEICRCMLDAAYAMIDALARYSECSGTAFDCRIGVDAGEVVAGMQGQLQPRFHLVGQPVFGSAKLESSAMSNRVNVSEQVTALLAYRESQ